MVCIEIVSNRVIDSLKGNFFFRVEKVARCNIDACVCYANDRALPCRRIADKGDKGIQMYQTSEIMFFKQEIKPGINGGHIILQNRFRIEVVEAKIVENIDGNHLENVIENDAIAAEGR